MDNLKLNSAQQQLFNTNQRLINVAVNRFHRRITLYGQGDAADLRQELEMALARAAQSYRLTAGASFKTFASRCLDNAARDFIRKLKQPPRVPFAPSSDAVAGHDVEGEDFHQTVEPFTYFDLVERGQAAAEQRFGLHDDEDGLVEAMQKKEIDALFAKVKLSGIERASFLLARNHDLDPQDIAEVFNVRVEVVSHALDRVVQKIRAVRGETA